MRGFIVNQKLKKQNKMNIYKHEGSGHYIGSCIIVVADSIEHARILIGNELVKIGLKDEELNIVEVDYSDRIIYSHNGDY